MHSAPRLQVSRVLLHIGDDPVVAEARRSILRRAGYSMITVKATSHAVQVLRTRAVDAVIFCHSVPSQAVDDIIREIRRQNSRLPVLSIYTGQLTDAYSTLSDRFADGLDGPQALLRAVKELFAEDKRGGSSDRR